MSTIVHTTDFKTLRKAYMEVKSFLEKESCDEVSSSHTKIDADLGMAGDDNWDMLTRFVIKYKLDTTGFDYSAHFRSEGELFGSGAVLLHILILPIVFILLLVRLFSFGRYDYSSKKIIPNWNRVTTDMTFGDMLIWYLTGKYDIRKNVRIELRRAA